MDEQEEVKKMMINGCIGSVVTWMLGKLTGGVEWKKG